MARKTKANRTADVRSLARSYTETAIKTLAGIMMQDTAPPSARAAAAESLLSRGWGKPKESVEVDMSIKSEDYKPDLASLLDQVRGHTRTDDAADTPPDGTSVH